MSEPISKAFSILICAHNEEKNIAQLIGDIYAQILPANWRLRQCLVISDCSDDQTIPILKQLSTQYPSLSYEQLPERQGKNFAYKDVLFCPWINE